MTSPASSLAGTLDDQATAVATYRAQIRFDGNSHLRQEAVNVEYEALFVKLQHCTLRTERLQHVTLEEAKPYTDSLYAR
jgi:hypothetical protein